VGGNRVRNEKGYSDWEHKTSEEIKNRWAGKGDFKQGKSKFGAGGDEKKKLVENRTASHYSMSVTKGVKGTGSRDKKK